MGSDSPLLTVQEVAKLLKCSPRHVLRLAKREAMPAPVRLGWLVRWRENVLKDWIDQGCQSDAPDTARAGTVAGSGTAPR